MTDIRLYTGLCETTYNHHPVAPGPLACVSPVYGKAKTYPTRITIPADLTEIIQDSGAFSDNRFKRKTFAEALERQQQHAQDYTYKAHPVETRGLERAHHVSLTRDWLGSFRQTPHYHPYSIPPKQGVLF